ncbi:probable folate-biopterin transporter 7 [Selaginella moellendorffii]|uniref:probable folate-biopterin transporter 7 n=1 Tax=Selaginella moellendorffii TaxID=88036 RepID=UPI000D1CF732|nr:probable folate-biopterin transporter 7 [Selaginella moellendorffii]|eukprot:XP_024543929.1 probable folate-biopterin transporter 7 [Selaginella moellendorffii]
MQGCAAPLSAMNSMPPSAAAGSRIEAAVWNRRVVVQNRAHWRRNISQRWRFLEKDCVLGARKWVNGGSWTGGRNGRMESMFRCRFQGRTTQRTANKKGKLLDSDEPISLPVALLSVPLGLEAGSWITSEVVSSYMWFKVVLRHVFPLAMTMGALENSSELLELSLDSSLGRMVLWKKRQSIKARQRRRSYGAAAEPVPAEKKIAGYLPVMSSASSYVWCPPSQQLLLPAPPTWSLLVAIESLSSELDCYVSRFKSGMKAPDWWDAMGETYGVSLLVLVGMGYWVQGFRCFPWLGMNYYFKDGLQLDPLTLQFLQNTVNLPYLAKPIYGIISDSVYIHGAHRVPYIIIAGICQVMSWGTIIAVPGARRSAGMLTAFLTFGNFGAAVADVANDALVAEAGKKKGCTGGQLQSFAWLASAAGGLLGNLLSGLALSGMNFESMFTIFVMFLVCHLAIAFMVSEQSFGQRKRDAGKGKMVAFPGGPKLGNLMKGAKAREMQVKAYRSNKELLKSQDEDKITESREPKAIDIPRQVSKLFGLIKSPEILLPLLWFMGSYAVIPTLSGTIFYYQSQALKINPVYLGVAKMLGQAGLLAGSMLYERYLKPVPLRRLVGCVQILLSVCMLADIGLVNRINLQLGIPDHFYILGASAFVEAIGQFKILPFMVFFAKLCPAGCEGSLLAFFMSCQCLSCIVSGYLGVALASFLAISASDFTQLGVGIVVQALAALVPLLGLSLLPGGEMEDEEEEEQEKGAAKVEKVM